jgi:hypothetical protein
MFRSRAIFFYGRRDFFAAALNIGAHRPDNLPERNDPGAKAHMSDGWAIARAQPI